MGRWDARGSARKIRQVIGAAALGPDGQLTEASEVILLGAMDGIGLSAGTRRRLDAAPLPRKVAELRGCALEEPLLSAVAAIAFSAMAAATDTSDAARRMPDLLLHLGMPRPTAEAATSAVMDEYLSARMVLTGHYRVLQAAIAGTALQLQLPIAQIVAATERVIACNPYDEARRANRRELTELISSGARIAAVMHAGTPAGPAMSVAVNVARRLFPRQGPAPAPHQLAAAFQAYATANGLPPAQARIWARGEYCLKLVPAVNWLGRRGYAGAGLAPGSVTSPSGGLESLVDHVDQVLLDHVEADVMLKLGGECRHYGLGVAPGPVEPAVDRAASAVARVPTAPRRSAC
jgi:hypothetical protein